MAKVHDKFVIELAEVIKGYGNDPDVDDPFRLSEFYRFYELPEIAVSANHFKTMIPLEVVEKNAQPGWIPCKTALPKENGQYIVTVKYEHVDGYEDIYSEHGEWVDGHWDAGWGHCGRVEKVLAWMPLPTPYREGGKE